MELLESSKIFVNKEIVESEFLEFFKFDINRVLKYGERFVGFLGVEYDFFDEDFVGEYIKFVI